MERINDLFAYEGLKIFQDDDYFKFSIDSTLIAFFVKITKRCNLIVDFCTGNAPIPMFLSTITDKKIIGVEVQKEIYELGLKSIKYNNLEDQISLINDNVSNLKNYISSDSVDIITVNPPYFKKKDTSFLNENKIKAIARHEVLISLEEIIIEAKRELKDKGSLVMVHRSDRFEEVVNLLNKHGFSLERIRFIYPKPGSESHIFLVDARKKGLIGGLKVLEPLYIYDESGNYTEEMIKYFHFKEDEYAKN